jgi:uncharacterized membrane protein
VIRVETSVFVRRPPEQVFAFISNFENNPEWQSGMVAARFTSEGPLGVGSTYTQVAKFLGRRVESTFEVIAYQPGRMVKATSTSGSFPITFTRFVEPQEGGCQVTAIVEGDASGFFRLAEPLLAGMVRRSIKADYVNLKAMLEASD